ncbi:DUF1236 domain-containing protein [Aquibium sp. ELW1220]|uniref:DUF1236 domain-containing protein n=1 Tax=Aquibium sp. ELW1220 TaxID=2976766 RepID=UPI0025B05E5F|nr:DUF1236 domain-containing protein [Aquibium sp. ELW1220]MDN2580335.1 DUF1236 domain-containing protein [Aquibium sp. ELW1220]
MKTMLTRTLALMLLAGTATFATQAGAEDGTTLKPTAGAKAGAQIEGGADVLRPSAATSASDNAPGQQKKAGDVDTAAEAAPGQLRKAGEVDSASEAAPGQMKKGASEETTANGTSASDNAPGQQKKAGDVDTAAEAAPGQLQKAGEVDSASEAAPGQMKKGVSDETTASIDLSAEQRTEVREIIVESNVQPVNVDFQVSIGAVVPTTVTLHPLPPRIVEIVPAYESYRYFVLANGQIIIVEPATLEVVYVIRA